MLLQYLAILVAYMTAVMYANLSELVLIAKKILDHLTKLNLQVVTPCQKLKLVAVTMMCLWQVWKSLFLLLKLRANLSD